MNELLVKENIKIEDMIYEVRGKQVMFDSDLAKLYQCVNGTKTINLAVKRNIERFPERFMFQLTNDELKNLNWFQYETSYDKRKYSSTLPYVFTEQGVAMLATILRTSVATEISIRIMDAFVVMRKYISSNNIEKRLSNVETKLIEHDNNFNIIMDKLDNTINNHLFFEGQIYDAYSLMLNIFNSSKNSIIIIDNYVDKNLLDILSKTNKKVAIITNKYNNEDYSKYKKQYNNIKLIINNTFHDRFIIIDKKVLYHSGSSFKDLGKKCFAITKVEDNDYLNELLRKI